MLKTLSNTLSWSAHERRIAGRVEAVNEGDEASQILSIDLPIPACVVQKIGGFVDIKARSTINDRFEILPAGVMIGHAGVQLWSICLAVPDPHDLNGDGVVDGADVGKVLAAWSYGSGPLIGSVLAAAGKGDRFVAWNSWPFSGGGHGGFKALAMLVVHGNELTEPTDAVLRIRIGVSPMTSLEIVVDASIVP